MTTKRAPALKAAPKAPTGIAGFDLITGGGVPRGRTTVIGGGPGSGKTVFGLQFLLHGAQSCNEPGILVALEETSDRILANAQSFGWEMENQLPERLFILNTQPKFDEVQSGDFDLCGMLAALQAKAKAMKARRIVFDALDMALVLLPDQTARRRELFRLHEWLLAHELTALITAKTVVDAPGFSTQQQPLALMQLMVDCIVILNHDVVMGISRRNLRVQKYRGSGFDEDEAPFVISKTGIEVAPSNRLRSPVQEPAVTFLPENPPPRPKRRIAKVKLA